MHAAILAYHGGGVRTSLDGARGKLTILITALTIALDEEALDEA